jgi:hypothetical protein
MFAICFLPLHKLCVFFRFPFTLLILLQDPNRANVDDTGYSFDRELAQQLRPTPAMFLPPPQALRPLSSFHLPLFFLVDPNFRPIVHDTVYLPDWNQQATAAPLLLQPLPPSFVSSSFFPFTLVSIGRDPNFELHRYDTAYPFDREPRGNCDPICAGVSPPSPVLRLLLLSSCHLPLFPLAGSKARVHR